MPADRRRAGSLGDTIRTFGRLAGERTFMSRAVTVGLAFAAMFAYISSSPFVLQDIYGVSPQVFSAVFGVNALGMVAASQVSGGLVGRVSPHRLLTAGLTATAAGGVGLLLAVGAAVAPLAGIGGTRTALPAAVVIATLGVGALLTLVTLGRRAPAVRPAEHNSAA